MGAWSVVGVFSDFQVSGGGGGVGYFLMSEEEGWERGGGGGGGCGFGIFFLWEGGGGALFLGEGGQRNF